MNKYAIIKRNILGKGAIMKPTKKGSVMILTFVFIFVLGSVLFFLLKDPLTSYACVEVHAVNSKSGGILLVKVEDKVILIGGTPKEEADEIANYLHKNSIQKVDAIILQEPTELFSGGYEKVVTSIPIKQCYIFKSESIDSYTANILEGLKDRGTDFKTYKSYGMYKTKGLKIEPFQIAGEGIKTTEFLGYNLYLPGLEYMWLPQNNDISKIDVNSFEKFKPDVVNISGIYRKALLKEEILDKVTPRILILGDMQGVLEEEKLAILQLEPEIEVLDMKNEGYIIIYLNNGTYDTTTFKKLNSIIL